MIEPLLVRCELLMRWFHTLLQSPCVHVSTQRDRCFSCSNVKASLTPISQTTGYQQPAALQWNRPLLLQTPDQTHISPTPSIMQARAIRHHSPSWKTRHPGLQVNSQLDQEYAAHRWHTPCLNKRAFSSQASGTPGSQGKEDPAPDLKTALRRLYKRIHPDLFGDAPEAKSENERSFKLLQEYLQQAKQGGRDEPKARVMYRFHFYLRETQDSTTSTDPHTPAAAAAAAPEQSAPSSHTSLSPPQPNASVQSQTDADSPTSSANGQAAGTTSASQTPGSTVEAGNNDASSKFRRVELALPPPAQPQGWGGGSGAEDEVIDSPDQAPRLRVAASVRRALTKLFSVCGVQVVPGLGEAQPSPDGTDMENDSYMDMDSSRLSSFLPQAMEAQRHAQASNQEPSVRVANIRGAFRLRKKLLVSFQDAQSLPPSQQVSHLTELAGVLDSLLDQDLEGASIVLGDTLGVDKLGNLCLDVRPGAGGGAAWAQLIAGVDMDFVRERKAYMQAVKELEQHVASSVGIASVFSSLPKVAAEPAYRAFLERLAYQGTTSGKVAGGACKDVALCVLPVYAFHMQQQAQQQTTAAAAHSQHTGAANTNSRGASTTKARVDTVQAVLCVPIELTAAEVYEAVRLRGHEVQECMKANEFRRKHLAALTVRVRTALRLRHLTRDQRLADHHFQAACQRLLSEAGALAHVADGGSLRVGFANRVWADGQIEIAHDFVF